jgi:hypothetical protein
MMTMTGLGISVAAIFVLPIMVGMILPDSKDIRPASRWWFGLVSFGILLIVLHGLRTPKTPVKIFLGFFLLSCLVISAFRVVGALRSGRIPALISFLKQNAWVLSCFLLLLIAGYAHVLSYPVSPAQWDAIATWFRKAKLLYHWVPLGNTPEVYWSYVTYPHLGSILEAMIMRLAGSLTENYGRLLMPAVYFFWMLAILSLRPAAKTWIFRLTAVAAAWIFFDLTAFTNGYQEGFLAAMAGMAAVHFTRIAVKISDPSCGVKAWPPDADLGMAFFFAGSLGFVKTEGGILSIILVGAFLLVFLGAYPLKESLRRLYALAPYLLLWIALLALWPLILYLNHADAGQIQGEHFTAASMSGFFKNLSRWAMISPFYWKYLQGKLVVLGVSAFLSAEAAVFIPRARRALCFLWLTLIAHLIFVPLPYFATAANPVWHLQTSFERLMFQHFFVYPILLCAAVSFLADKIGENKTQGEKT